jgi:hypothetical protein
VAGRGYVTLLFENGSVFLITQNSNNPVVRSPALDTYTIPYFKKDYSILIENSNAYLYGGSTLLGSVSGAPSGAVSGGGGGLFSNISSTDRATVNQFRFYIQNLVITWG